MFRTRDHYIVRTATPVPIGSFGSSLLHETVILRLARLMGGRVACILILIDEWKHLFHSFLATILRLILIEPSYIICPLLYRENNNMKYILDLEMKLRQPNGRKRQPHIYKTVLSQCAIVLFKRLEIVLAIKNKTQGKIGEFSFYLPSNMPWPHILYLFIIFYMYIIYILHIQVFHLEFFYRYFKHIEK